MTEELNYECIYKEIAEGVDQIEWSIPESIQSLYLAYEEGNMDQLQSEKIDPDELNRHFEALLQGLIKMLTPAFERIDAMKKEITDHAFLYLLTGETEDIEEDWFGGVYTMEMFGETMVVAMASSASDVKALSDQFRAEHRRIFGEQAKLTKGRLNTADFLRMKYEGKSISDIADNYILRHPSEFPKDPRSKAYREAKRKKQESIRKSMQRLEEVFQRKIGDKK